MIEMIGGLVEGGHAYASERRRLLLGALRPRLRLRVGQQRRRPDGRRAHRGGRSQARPARLRPVEGRKARRAHVGLALGPGQAGVAQRVRRDGAPLPGHARRHPRRRQRPGVPAPRERVRPGPDALGGRVRQPLDAHRHAARRRREDVQEPRQLLHAQGGARRVSRGGAAPAHAADPLPQPARLFVRAAARRGGTRSSAWRPPSRTCAGASRTRAPRPTPSSPRISSRRPRRHRPSSRRAWTTTSTPPAPWRPTSTS